MRGIQYAAAPRFRFAVSGILDRPLSRTMTADAHPRSRDTLRPSYASIFRPLKKEGAGNAGCPMHRSLVCAGVVQVCTPVFTAEAPETSGIPHAMVLRLIRDLPGDEFLFATVISRIVGRARPVGPLSPPQGLASATDARTTRLRRTQQCRSSRAPFSTAHEFCPPCDHMRTRHRRVHHIPPHVS
jgi:hypothetical protein